MIVSPHPDDEIISCGGLLLKAENLNWDVFVLYMCTGKGRQLVTGHTSEHIRLKELKKVSRRLSFKYKVMLKGIELRMDTLAQRDIINVIEDEIEQFKPDILVIPPSSSYDQDHREIYKCMIVTGKPF